MEDRLRKYARLAVQGGVHLQNGQTLMIHADVMAAPFVAW
ncbi:MAG: aminopeptidase [Merdibacter sp.]